MVLGSEKSDLSGNKSSGGGVEHPSRLIESVLETRPRVASTSGGGHGNISDVVMEIFWMWGTPQVDLFATRENSHCLSFCTLQYPTQGGWGMRFS